MGFDNRVDLEFGNLKFGRGLEKLRRIMNSHYRNIKRFSIFFLCVLLSVLIKLASMNVNYIASTVDSMGEAITLSEPTYIPFHLTTELVATPLEGTQQFPITHSAMNQKMQTLNLAAAITSVETFLETTGSRCTHLKYFGVPYDLIVVKHNYALDEASTPLYDIVVNPEVREVSSTLHRRQVENVYGETEYIKLPSYLIIDYVTAELETRYGEKFTGELGYCLWYYIYT